MFERFKSHDTLDRIIKQNYDKAREYGERISNLKSCDQQTLGMSSSQINSELEHCYNSMLRCERRIDRAARYL